MIKIGRVGQEEGEYVGRRFMDQPHSPLACPFTGKGAVDRYREYLLDLVKQEDELVLRELNRLWEIHQSTGALTLLCWCKKRPCHAEPIREVLESMTEPYGV